VAGSLKLNTIPSESANE